MNKIGREVAFLATKENNPRNGEGTFLRLQDGSILYAYSGYIGEDWDDFMPADIRGIYSYDEGETWENDQILLAHDEDSVNYMCPSLLRMENGDVGLFYLRKYNCMGGVADTVCLVRSQDEGKTWSEPICCTSGTDYIVMENDHVIRLQSGRILIPLNFHTKWVDGKLSYTGHGLMYMVASDDDGKTWQEISNKYDIPFTNCSRTGLQETAVYQFKDGTIRALSRTDMAFQYECFSQDNGVTWTQPQPNRFFTSPDAPLLMKPAGEYTVAVFNPIPRYTGRSKEEWWGRTPFVMAVSTDDGNSFPGLFYLEDDMTSSYCYPAIFDGGDYILVAYYHSNHTRVVLGSNKIIKIMKEEIQI